MQIGHNGEPYLQLHNISFFYNSQNTIKVHCIMSVINLSVLFFHLRMSISVLVYKRSIGLDAMKKEICLCIYVIVILENQAV